ncbi:hypothetical protein, partial [Ornithinimicrobium cavernae]|uniref:hypothetical protein n=1 Tax=Ornithinimicrobium cavernae TaxID=2666047 RepID=UPI0012B166DC
MDTKIVQQRLRAGLRRPPVVRSRSARPAAGRSLACSEGFSDQLWVTSWQDLRIPVEEDPGAPDSRGALPVDDPSDAATDRGSEAVTDPQERLRAALADLGLEEVAVESLTDVALACATVATTDEQPSVVARGQALLGSIESLTTAAGRLDAVLLSATTQLTATNGQLLLLDKEAVSPEE